MNFWDSNAWGFLLLIGVLLFSMLVANLLKKSIPFLRVSLIPTSVLGGILLLIVSVVYTAITGSNLFDASLFGEYTATVDGESVTVHGRDLLEIVTYHALGIGFVATAFKPEKKQQTKQRSKEIFDTGVTTVSTYLLQAVLGLSVTFIAALILPDFFKAAGILLPFGYGQGTGQALNYGGIYQSEYGFEGGKNFGLTIAALGFLSASVGGVIHLNVLRKKGKVKLTESDVVNAINSEEIQSHDEVPMNGSIDKMTIQIAMVLCSYALAYAAMWGLSALISSFRATLFGFNFLFGVLFAVLIQATLRLLKKKQIVKKEYVNPFLMKRIGGFFFDVMIVAGIGAIRMELIKDNWIVLLILGIVGAVATYCYNLFVAKTLFKDYAEEQFLVMYGMLTGTASTGMILLREIDPEFKTCASENLVYQNFPAIVFGFPMMLLATLCPKSPYLTFGIIIAFFIAMNVILFRSKIFKKRKRA